MRLPKKPPWREGKTPEIVGKKSLLRRLERDLKTFWDLSWGPIPPIKITERYSQKRREGYLGKAFKTASSRRNYILIVSRPGRTYANMYAVLYHEVLHLRGLWHHDNRFMEALVSWSEEKVGIQPKYPKILSEEHGSKVAGKVTIQIGEALHSQGFGLEVYRRKGAVSEPLWDLDPRGDGKLDVRLDTEFWRELRLKTLLVGPSKETKGAMEFLTQSSDLETLREISQFCGNSKGKIRFLTACEHLSRGLLWSTRGARWCPKRKRWLGGASRSLE